MSVREFMLHEELLKSVGVPVREIPSFQRPFPEPVQMKKKGELGWACQGQQISACRHWANSHSTQDIGDDELQTFFCRPCRPRHTLQQVSHG